MAENNEISKVVINNVSYELCDTTARTHLLSKHGDIIDGNIFFAQAENDTRNKTGTIYFRPNNHFNLQQWPDKLKGYASSGYITVSSQNYEPASSDEQNSNHHDFVIGLQGVHPGETQYSYIQSIRLSGESVVNNNTGGYSWNPKVILSAPKAWREAIQAIGTTGNNTITDGSLTIKAKENNHQTGYLRVNGSDTSKNTTTTYDGRVYIPADGAIVTRNIRGTKYDYKLIGDNGENLWIGAGKGTDSYHHTGGTYISTGWASNDSDIGNESIWVGVPSGRKSDQTNVNRSVYKVYHQGNLSQAFTVVYKTFTITSRHTGFSFYNFSAANSDTIQFTNVRPISAWGTVTQDKASWTSSTYSSVIQDPSNDNNMKKIFNDLGQAMRLNVTQVVFSPSKITTSSDGKKHYANVTGGFWIYDSNANSSTYTTNVNIAFLCVPIVGGV